MAYKRIIIGDQEIKIPKISMGVFPLVGIALLLWMLTGIYIVGPDEVGVVQTFGKYSRAAQSGLNYHFPFPFEKVSTCLLYTSPSPRDATLSRMPSSA